MIKSLTFNQNSLGLLNLKTYAFVGVFVLGNLILPQICHMIPNGGKIFLPIYFFTLVASYKFGIKAGLMTAILSPLLNHLMFGMPMAAMLPVLLIKSSLLAVVASYVAHKSAKVSILLLLSVVAIYQLIGALAEWFISGSFSAAIQDLTLGLPGISLQVVIGYIALRLLRK